MGDVKLPGGAFINRELFKLSADSNCYSQNAGMSHEITEEQLEMILDYYTSHNYYVLYQNNCATIAAGAWSEALIDDFSMTMLYIRTPVELTNVIMKNGGEGYKLEGLYGTDPLLTQD